MISLNQCCAVCTNCSDSLRMARFHYMSPSSLLSFFPSFFLSLFLPLFSGLVSNENEVYTVMICVGISVQLCNFFKSQFNPDSAEGWRAQGCSFPTCFVGRQGQDSAGSTNAQVRFVQLLPALRTIPSLLLEILPGSVLLRWIPCRNSSDPNPLPWPGVCPSRCTPVSRPPPHCPFF